MTTRKPATSDRTAASPETALRNGADTDSRVAITVLGMHRSGTSAFARVLSLVGADLPGNLMPARPGNAPGHWEPQRIVELNDELLASASSGWDDVSAFPADWYGSPPEAELRRRAVELLAEEYGGSRLFVVKDPRICRIVPFWVSALAEFGASPSFVLPIRNPLEVAASLRERDEFSLTKGLLLWLQHTLAAESDTRSYPRVFVSYEGLLNDWESQVRTISDALQVSWPGVNHEARDEVERFLATRHRHQRFSADELDAHSAVVPWVRRSYAAFKRACETGDTPDVELLNEIARQLRQADRSYGPILATWRGIAAERREALEDRANEAQRIGAEVERLNRELTASLEATEGVKRELEVRREEVASLTRALEKRDGSLQEREAELDARRHRAVRAQREVRLRNEEIARLENELAARLAEIKQNGEEIERLESDLDTVREQHEELLDARAQATIDEQRVSALERRVEEQERELRSREEQLADQARELQQLAAREVEHDELTGTLAARDEELERRAAALAEAETAIAELRAELRGIKTRLAERETSIERLSADAAAREARDEELRRELATRDAELSERASEVSELRDEAARRASEADELVAHVDDLSSALDRIGGDVEALIARFGAVRDETALTYLAARPASRFRLAITLFGWSLWPPRFNDLRSYRTIRRSGRFDANYYLLRYPDVATARRHPILHYIQSGAREGRDPSASFSTRAYLAEHSELERSGPNPFAHFLRSGTGDATPELEAGE